MAKYKAEKIASFICWAVGAGLFLGAFLSSSWISARRANYGLMEWCVDQNCYNYHWIYPGDHPLYKNIVLPKTLLLAGVGLTGAALLVGLLGVCCTKSFFFFFEGFLHIVGSALIWSGCGIFTVNNYSAESIRDSLLKATNFQFEDGQYFHFSFYIAWISGLLFILAGAYAIIAGKKLSKHCC